LIGRIVRSADFERVMAAPSPVKSRHFVLHHLVGVPSLPLKPRAVRQRQAELSTVPVTSNNTFVDDSGAEAPAAAPDATVWLGLVVPKRHAKRSVTRTLLKRQMRAAVQRQQSQPAPLKRGLWVLRLRAVFDVAQFPSAASKALADAVRDELRLLLGQAALRGGAESGRHQGRAS
jgi:ribonuclease P protein component